MSMIPEGSLKIRVTIEAGGSLVKSEYDGEYHDKDRWEGNVYYAIGACFDMLQIPRVGLELANLIEYTLGSDGPCEQDFFPGPHKAECELIEAARNVIESWEKHDEQLDREQTIDPETGGGE